MKLAPCDCRNQKDVSKLQEQRIDYNEYSIEVQPDSVYIRIKDTAIKMPMDKFKKLAEWYLEPQTMLSNGEILERYIENKGSWNLLDNTKQNLTKEKFESNRNVIGQQERSLEEIYEQDRSQAERTGDIMDKQEEEEWLEMQRQRAKKMRNEWEQRRQK